MLSQSRTEDDKMEEILWVQHCSSNYSSEEPNGLSTSCLPYGGHSVLSAAPHLLTCTDVTLLTWCSFLSLLPCAPSLN